MQLTDLRDRVLERIGLSDGDSSLPDAVGTNLLNAANRQISMMHDWPWQLTVDATWTALTADQVDYVPSTDYATNVRKTLYIVIDGFHELQIKQEQDIARYQTDASSRPQAYTIEGTTIRILPKPDSAYSVRHVYFKTDADLSSDSDEPSITDWAIDLLIVTAAQITAGRLNDIDLQRVLNQEYVRLLKSIRDEVRGAKQFPLPKHRNDIGW